MVRHTPWDARCAERHDRHDGCVRTTAASAQFKDRVPDQDAEVVRRLKAAGAVLLGKLNLHEFAYGATSVPSYFGAVHNPWKPDHIAGGSSGGPAVAVSAGLCYGALGTDTGGSIRNPPPLQHRRPQTHLLGESAHAA